MPEHPKLPSSELLERILAMAALVAGLETIWTFHTGFAPFGDAARIVAVALWITLAWGLAVALLVPARFQERALIPGIVALFALRGAWSTALADLALRVLPNALFAGVAVWLVPWASRRMGGFGFGAVACGLLAATTLAFGLRTDQFGAFSSRPVAPAAIALLVGGAGFLWWLRRRGRGLAAAVVASAWLLVVATGFARASQAPSPRLNAPASARHPRLNGPPNVVLIVLDTVRPDHLSPYGYPRPTTPRLAELAEQSLVFSRAYANATFSLPSHASLMTGLLPSEHGAHDVPAPGGAGGEFYPLSPGATTLAEELAALGYHTAGVSGNDVFLAGWTGLQRGFQTFFTGARRRYAYAPLASPALQRLGRLVPALGLDAEAHWQAADVTAAASSWVAQVEQPYFLFLNYFDAHNPYERREPYFSWFREDGLGSLEPEHVAYDSEIAAIDASLGTLFDQLRGLRQFDESLIIVTADHGEYLGEGGRRYHGGGGLHEPLLRVPLLVKEPLQSTRRSVESLVTLRDVRGFVRQATSGAPIDLEPLATNAPRLVAESWNDAGSAEDDGRLPRAVAVYADGLKLIERRSGRCEMYDLRADPAEILNLLARASEIHEAAHRRLRDLAVTPVAAPPGIPSALDAATRERLRALGYIK